MFLHILLVVKGEERLLGMLCRQERGAVRLERVRIGGMDVLCAHVTPEGRRAHRQLARAVRLLRRGGVRRCLPGEGEWPDVPIPAVEGLPLYRALADRLILQALAQRGIAPQHAAVVLRGEYPDGDLTAAAWRLCPRVRQVIVDTRRGGADLQHRLYREFGAPVGPVRAGGRMLCVRFGGPLAGEELSLCEQEDASGFEIEVPGLELPECLQPGPVLCALWQGGLLDLGQIRVQSVEQGNKIT